MSGERKSDWWKVKAHAHARTRPPACLYAHHQAPAAELLFTGIKGQETTAKSSTAMTCTKAQVQTSISGQSSPALDI
ncbi:hypothetical protein FOWG_06271 [Fusarium oxysporum f. sp. lycopersici MN25]|uniref:Uncharacterized protein n=1 Tax=Fusarium oxysporum Fo47 TaxID=660027 RepID=W9KVQ9_FUSOX|nr:hypothetical protein FOZG_04034 [Fusarium oxysporum Fo47]EWZ93576.1 hypothetical protein FOWG_06271 [Fusarium oxysporum f. sp. lycopersici MN25]